MSTTLSLNELLAELLPAEKAALEGKTSEMQAKYMTVRGHLLASTEEALRENLDNEYLYDEALHSGLNKRAALLTANLAQLAQDLEAEGNAPFRPLYMFAGIYAA